MHLKKFKLKWRKLEDNLIMRSNFIAFLCPVLLITSLLIHVCKKKSVELTDTTYGGRIVFETGRDGNSEIYIMDGDGGNQTNLTLNESHDNNPIFSPDGSKIAFKSYRDYNEDIFIMNVDGSNQLNLTNDAGVDSSPDCQPI